VEIAWVRMREELALEIDQEMGKRLKISMLKMMMRRKRQYVVPSTPEARPEMTLAK
jgi:hypothetical protein